MDWLEQVTYHSSEYWMFRVQALIAEHTSAPAEENEFGSEQDAKIKGHGNTDMSAWLQALQQEIERCSFDPIEPVFGFFPYDGNMRMAAILGTILSLWYASTQQAKLMDPRRPLPPRLASWPRFAKWREGLVNLLFDLSKLPTYFPDQPWQLPWDSKATGGSFL